MYDVDIRIPWMKQKHEHVFGVLVCKCLGVSSLS